MCIEQTFLSAILSMKHSIEKNQEPDGKFSIQTFIEAGHIDYSNNDNDDLYVRDSKRGDYVIHVEQNNPIVREIVWTERVADKETYSYAKTIGFKDVVAPGTGVCLMRNISTIANNPLYVTDSYVTIPEGHVAMVKHNADKAIGFIVVVPNLFK